MAIKVPSADDAAKKWNARASSAGPDYTKGIENTTGWAAATAGADARRVAGLAKSNAAGTFAKNVQKVGDAGWKARVAKVGADRFVTGVAASEDAMRSAASKNLSVISAVTLPEKGNRGDDKNWERSKVVGKALAKAREAGQLGA